MATRSAHAADLGSGFAGAVSLGDGSGGAGIGGCLDVCDCFCVTLFGIGVFGGAAGGVGAARGVFVRDGGMDLPSWVGSSRTSD